MTTNECELFHAHFNALFYSAHYKIFILVSALQKIQNETYSKMRSVTAWKFKESATFKKVNLISTKIGHYRVNLIWRIEFLSSVSYKSLPNTRFYFLITCIYVATCYFCNCACYCTKDNRHCACQTAVSWEIWGRKVYILKININLWHSKLPWCHK